MLNDLISNKGSIAQRARIAKKLPTKHLILAENYSKQAKSEIERRRHKRIATIGIIAILLVPIGWLIVRSVSKETKITQNALQGTNISTNFDIKKVEGDIVGGNKVIKQEGISKAPKENMKVKLYIKRIKETGRKDYPEGWDVLRVDVVNMGTIEVALEKADLYCNNKLIGTASLKEVHSEKTDKPYVQQYTEYYPRMKPGDKFDDIVHYFEDLNDYEKLADWQFCKGKLEVRIVTTRGNTFSGFVER